MPRSHLLSLRQSCSGSTDVSVRVGGSVQLDVQIKGQTFTLLLWKHSNKNIIRYYPNDNTTKKHDSYKDRVEFNNKTYTLTLKNLQKTDSGLYEAIIRSQKETTLAQYNLSVWDPVEAPVLTLYNTTDPCNSTLTCRGHDLSITSTCYKETCEEKEVTSPGGVALFLSIKDSLIICNLSNPVSWRQDNITLQSCDSGGTHILDQTHPSLLKLNRISSTVSGRVLTCRINFLFFIPNSPGNASAECENTIYQDVGVRFNKYDFFWY
uniref:Immunoglobulin domain-containing protein n=1 Tax=Astyanax mexicanus TaxID=7994 RepID=A0A3B1IMV1_ASTMX